MSNFFKVPIAAAWIVNSPSAANLLHQLREYVLRRLSGSNILFEEVNTIFDELFPFNKTPSLNECPDSVDWYMYDELFGTEFLHYVLNIRQTLRDQVAASAGIRDNPDLWYFQVFKDNFLILEPKAQEFFSIDEQDALEVRLHG